MADPSEPPFECDEDPTFCDCSEHENARRAEASHAESEPLPQVDGWWWNGTRFCNNDPQYHEMTLGALCEIAALAGLAIMPAADVPSAEYPPDMFQRVLAFMRESDEWGTPEDVMRSAVDAGLSIVARRADKDRP